MDNEVTGGNFYYYTIYLHDDTGWHRVAVAMALAISDRGYDDILWSKIPRFYQYIPRALNGQVLQTFNSAEVYTTDRTDQGNFYLQQFLSVFGFGISGIHDYIDTVLSVNNPSKIDLENLHHLATQVGTNYEYEVPGRIMRKRVDEAAYLARNRGTLSGLRELVIATVGWDVDLSMSNNLFLTKDQSQFYHPIFDEWDSGTVYAEGDRVNFAGHLFEAKEGGAYGLTEAPPLDTDENTWWAFADIKIQPELVDDNGSGIATLNQWAIYQSDDGVQVPAQMATAVTSTVETAEASASNALFVSNDDESSHEFDVISVNPSIDPTDEDIQRVTQGLPIPTGLLWDESRTYLKGDLVVNRGVIWRSIRENRGKRPNNFHNDWENLGSDERVPLVLSGYGHAGDGTGATVSASVSFDLADSRGRLINQQLGNPFVSWSNSGEDLGVYDTFNDSPGSILVTRTPDVFKASSWFRDSGEWTIVEDSAGQAVSPTPEGKLLMHTPVGWSMWRIAVTLSSSPLSGRKQGIIFRIADQDTYGFVTRDGVYYRDGGSLTLISSFVTDIQDGDRVMVELDNADPSEFSVFVNETHVGTYDLPFSNTSDYFGIGVVE